MDFKKLLLERYERATPAERAAIDRREREREADLALPRARVKATRTSCITGEEKEIEIVLVARPGHDGQLWIYVDEGGPTGYESISLEGLEQAVAEDKPWAACFGTKGRWDGLTVPAASLRIARDVLVPTKGSRAGEPAREEGT